MKFKIYLILISPLLFTGCASLQPDNQFKQFSDTLGPDKIMNCALNAKFFQEKGKNPNTDFGRKYVKPYSTKKWETARLMQQFYGTLAQNIPEATRDRLYDKYSNSEYYTKEIADDCQKTFDSAPSKLKNAAFNESPFFSDPQRINIVCQSNSITNAEDAIIYFRSGNSSRDVQRAFGTCVSVSTMKNIRDFQLIYTSSRLKDRFVGSFVIDGKFYFTPLTQFDSYTNISYFPDLKK